MSAAVTQELIISGLLIAVGIIVAVLVDLIRYRGLRNSDRATKFLATLGLGLFAVAVFCIVMSLSNHFDVKIQHITVYVITVLIVDRCILRLKFTMNRKKK